MTEPSKYTCLSCEGTDLRQHPGVNGLICYDCARQFTLEELEAGPLKESDSVPVPASNLELFWSVVANANLRKQDDDTLIEALMEDLATRRPNEILALIADFERVVMFAHRISLSTVYAELYPQGGDDDFYGFCCRLISMGRKTLEKSVQEPETVRDLKLPREPHFLEFKSAFVESYEKMTHEMVPCFEGPEWPPRTFDDFVNL